jgi:hypothetical protein
MNTIVDIGKVNYFFDNLYIISQLFFENVQFLWHSKNIVTGVNKKTPRTHRSSLAMSWAIRSTTFPIHIISHSAEGVSPKTRLARSCSVQRSGPLPPAHHFSPCWGRMPEAQHTYRSAVGRLRAKPHSATVAPKARRSLCGDRHTARNVGRRPSP